MPTNNLTSREESSVDLYWIPLGAGRNTRCVRANGMLFEAACAVRQHRPRCDLYHAALEVHLHGDRYVLEMAPSWDHPAPDRGVVGEGPVGLRLLGRTRWFRYEIRCWNDGVVPDISDAVDSPQRMSSEAAKAHAVLALAPLFPTATWGRDELGAGGMWNSNSLVAWLLALSGHEMGRTAPPAQGRAPGWSAGLAVAARNCLDATEAPGTATGTDVVGPGVVEADPEAAELDLEGDPAAAAGRLSPSSL